MQLPSAFSTEEHPEEMSDFTAFEAGEQLFIFDKSSVEKTAKAISGEDPSGRMMKLNAVIIAGELKGRRVFVNLNIANKNPQAVEIANKEFTSICNALGKTVVKDTDELHGIPFIGNVGIEVDSNGKYPDRNVMKGYTKYDGPAIEGLPEAQQATPAAALAAVNGEAVGEKKARPWD